MLLSSEEKEILKQSLKELNDKAEIFLFGYNVNEERRGNIEVIKATIKYSGTYNEI